MSFGTSDIRVGILGDDSSLKRAFESARRQASETSKTFDKTSKSSHSLFSGASAASMAGGAAVVIGVLGDAAGAALEYEDKLEKLKVAMGNSHISYEAHKKDIQGIIDANIHLGTKEDDTLDLLTQGVTATGSLSKATEYLQTAQNVSVATGKDLASSYMAVIKASEGQLKPLKQLGLDLPIAAGGALKTKLAYEGLLKAQQDLKNAEDTSNQSTAKQTEKANATLIKAKERLLFLEEQTHTGKKMTISQEQAIVRAQEAVRAAEAAATNTTTSGADRIAKAKAKVTAAEQKLKDVSTSGAQIIAAINAKTAGQAEAQANTTLGKLHEEQAKFDEFKRMLGERVVTFMATDVIPGLEGIGRFELAFGHDFKNDVIDPLINAWNEADHLYSSLKSALGLDSGAHDDSAAIYARNDAAKGWAPGTTQGLAGAESQPPEHMQGQDPTTGKGSKLLSYIKVMNGIPLTVGDYGYKPHGPMSLPINQTGNGATFYGPVAQSQPHVTINMHAQPTASAVNGVLARHAKRNGHAAFNARYTAVAPAGGGD